MPDNAAHCPPWPHPHPLRGVPYIPFQCWTLSCSLSAISVWLSCKLLLLMLCVRVLSQASTCCKLALGHSVLHGSQAVGCKDGRIGHLQTATD